MILIVIDMISNLRQLLIHHELFLHLIILSVKWQQVHRHFDIRVDFALFILVLLDCDENILLHELFYSYFFLAFGSHLLHLNIELRGFFGPHLLRKCNTPSYTLYFLLGFRFVSTVIRGHLHGFLFIFFVFCLWHFVFVETGVTIGTFSVTILVFLFIIRVQQVLYVCDSLWLFRACYLFLFVFLFLFHIEGPFIRFVRTAAEVHVFHLAHGLHLHGLVLFGGESFLLTAGVLLIQNILKVRGVQSLSLTRHLLFYKNN